MFESVNVKVPDAKGNQKPVNVRFEISCEFNPETSEPICKIRYNRKPFLGLIDQVEDTIDGVVSEEPLEVEGDVEETDSVRESNETSQVKKFHPEKIPEKSARKDEDESVSQLTFRCIAESVEN